MQDETKGTKTNTVMLNIAQAPGLEPPEPGIAPVIIDGNPIHAVRFIQIQAGSDQITLCSIQFECEVTGKIAGKAVEDMLEEIKNRKQ